MTCPVDSLIEVSIIEDDIWALSTELESNIFQVTLSSCFHDFSADQGTSSESDLFDFHVGRDGGTDGVSVSGNEIEDT